MLKKTILYLGIKLNQHSLPCSYQTSNYSANNNLNKDKKSAAVKQIAEQLETNEENVSKKMASLRSYYCQLRSQYKSAKTKSGSGTADIKKPTWPFFDSLKFLDDNLTVKGTSSSINLSEVS